MPSIKPLKTPTAFSVKQNLKEMQIGFLEIHEANGDRFNFFGKRYDDKRSHLGKEKKTMGSNLPEMPATFSQIKPHPSCDSATPSPPPTSPSHLLPPLVSAAASSSPEP